ncbi:MAG: DsbA family protein [Vicinamibacterales bacterium]
MQLKTFSYLTVLYACVAAGITIRGAVARAQTETTVSGAVVARLDGAAIRESELDDWWQAQDPASYQRVRQDLYAGRRRALDAIVSDAALKSEAAKRGVNAEDLLSLEATKRAPATSDLDISRFLAATPLPAGTSPDRLRPTVAAYLAQKANEEARGRYLDELRSSLGRRLSDTLAPPRVEVHGDTWNPTSGPTDAAVQLTVFSDFECPYCKRFEPTLTKLMETYRERIRIVWRHFPLAIHEKAFPAALAAQCAHDQGRFWAYHDVLFANQGRLADADLKRMAREIGVTMSVFESCLDSGTHRDQIQSDLRAGGRLGVTGTPTVFINGRVLIGALDQSEYEKAIVEELAADSTGRGGKR